jgi:hypothetical protein
MSFTYFLEVMETLLIFSGVLSATITEREREQKECQSLKIYL